MRFLFALLACVSFLPELPAAPFVVVTWNTRWLPGGHPNANEKEKQSQMHREQAILKVLNPDILLLQEVADWEAAQEVCSVVPGLKVQVVSSFITRPQNLVIASKFPVDSAWYDHWNPNLGEDDPPRGYAFAAIKLPDGRTLLTYAVHMKSNLGGIEANIDSRVEAVKQWTAHVKEIEKVYGARGGAAVLIGGDFNTSPDGERFAADPTLQLMKDAGLKWVFEGVPAAQRVTIPGGAKFPPDNFDHIFFSGLRLKSVRVADGKSSSDHNPVVATFEP